MSFATRLGTAYSGHARATATAYILRNSSGEAPHTCVPYVIAGLNPVLATAHERLPVARRHTRNRRILPATLHIRAVSWDPVLLHRLWRRGAWSQPRLRPANMPRRKTGAQSRVATLTAAGRQSAMAAVLLMVT